MSDLSYQAKKGPPKFLSRFNTNDYRSSEEQEDTWFLGSIMQHNKKMPLKDHNRMVNLHNRITHEETKYDDRFQKNKHIASQLEEFFPKKWLIEITSKFRNIRANQLGIKTRKDRILSFLGFIELYLNFRGLTLLDSTIIEINSSLGSKIKKYEVRSWKLKILKLFPDLREEWIKIRAKNHQTALISTIITIVNTELKLDTYTKKDIFKFKQKIIQLSTEFSKTSKFKYIKKPEVWARAICLKAFREIYPGEPCDFFISLPHKTQRVLENKRWQLDQIINVNKKEF